MPESGEPRSSSWDGLLGGAGSEVGCGVTVTYKAESPLPGLHLWVQTFVSGEFLEIASWWEHPD